MIVWFQGDNLIFTVDTFFNFNPNQQLYSALFAWKYQFSTGTPYPDTPSLVFAIFWSGLSTIGLSLVDAQRVIFYVLFAGSGLAFQYFAVAINRDYRRVRDLTSAIFYMTNPFALSYVWWHNTWIVYSYVLFPVLFGLYVRGVRGQGSQLKLLTLSAIASVILAPGLAPVYVIVMTVALLLFAIWMSLTQKSDLRRVWSFTALYATTIAVASMWWLLPILPYQIYGYEYSNAFVDPTRTLDAVSSYSTMSNTMRLLGLNLIYLSAGSDSFYAWTAYYLNPAFQVLTFVVPLSAFAAVILRKTPEVLFMSVISLGAIFMMKGSSPPFGFVNVWMMLYLPFGGVLKNPYYEFGLVLPLSYGFLLGHTAQSLFQRAINCTQRATRKEERARRFRKSVTSRQFSSVALSTILITLGLLAIPFVNGDVYSSGGATLPSQRVRVPWYYPEAGAWINSQPGEWKIISLPFTYQGASAFDWEAGIQGNLDPIDQYFFDRPIVRSYYPQPTANVITDEISALFAADWAPRDVVSAAALINAKYFLVHRDWDSNFMGNLVPAPSTYEGVLNRSSEIGAPMVIGRLAFYPVNSTLPLVYVPKLPVELLGNNLSFGNVARTMWILNMTASVEPVFYPGSLLNAPTNQVVVGSCADRVCTLELDRDGNYTLSLVRGSQQTLPGLVSIDNMTLGAITENEFSTPRFLMAGQHQISETHQPLFNGTFEGLFPFAFMSGNWTLKDNELVQNDEGSLHAMAYLTYPTYVNYTLGLAMTGSDSSISQGIGNGLIFDFDFVSNSGFAIRRTGAEVAVLEIAQGVWRQLHSVQLQGETNTTLGLGLSHRSSGFDVTLNGSTIFVHALPGSRGSTGLYVGLDGSGGAVFSNFTYDDPFSHISLLRGGGASYEWQPSTVGTYATVDGIARYTQETGPSRLVLNQTYEDGVELATEFTLQDSALANSPSWLGIVFHYLGPSEYYLARIVAFPSGDSGVEVWRYSGSNAFLISSVDTDRVAFESLHRLSVFVLPSYIEVHLDNKRVLRSVPEAWSPSGPRWRAGIGMEGGNPISVQQFTVTPHLVLSGLVVEIEGGNPPVHQPSIKFKMNTPSHYSIDVTDASGPFILVLSQTFDPAWKAESTDSSFRAMHFEANWYANAWLIDSEANNFAMTLEYSTQTLYTVGFISTVVGTPSLLLVVMTLRKRRQME